MQIKLVVNKKELDVEINAGDFLIDVLRANGFASVKRGCDTTNCGLCTVWLDGKPILSCAMLAARAEGHEITTLEGIKKEAETFGKYLVAEGGDQCGYCSPGFVMNVVAMKRELNNPTEEEIKNYLLGNLCRCTGYQSQLRAIKNYLRG